VHDARIDPARLAGLAKGRPRHRNAGGRASDDALRSLVISTQAARHPRWFVIHHTNCGMELFTDEVMPQLLAGSLETGRLSSKGWENTAKVPACATANSSTG